MSRRLSLIPPALLLGACLVVLPACKKKPAEEGGGGVDPAGGALAPSGPPPAVSTDYFLFARLDAKSIRDSALFGEVKQAVTKAGGAKEWGESEAQSAAEIGVKWTEIDTASLFMPDTPVVGATKVVAIVTASKAFDKAALFKKEKAPAPDPSGFYKVEKDTWFHFPDDKTLVALSPEYAQKYLGGYAKNKSGWPVNADLSRAAAGHTVFAVVNVQKVPRELLAGAGEQFAALAATQKVAVTADLRGKELSLGVRASYASADAATKAKEQAQALLDMASGFIGMAAGGKEMAELAALKPAVTEAQRAVKAAKLEATGSDLTLAASYRADFDIGTVVTEAVKKIRGAAGQTVASNNLKQIGLGIHEYAGANTNQSFPVNGIGPNGQMRGKDEKALLSWRVAMLPYIGQGALYKEFKLDEPWDGPNNKKLIEKMPQIFAPVAKPGKSGFTHLQMVLGPTAMPPGNVSFLAPLPDGLSNTVAVVEAAEPVIWTKPDDVMLPAKLAPGELKKKFGGQFPGGFHVVMWDGSARFVRDSVSERTLAAALNPFDGVPLGSDW